MAPSLPSSAPSLGTPRIQHRPHTQKVDVYGFGIVLWELIIDMPIIPNDCLLGLREIMTCYWDANPKVCPPFTKVVRMLENAEMEIMTTIRKSHFRCCKTQPMIVD
uniref:Protein kinase domain-containing protein n=1 Tax=Nelumbo nucifera TaxID=4432 RepID=A0A822X8V6_NELNU|nr:TPA_asm: hypothetical protein HUJ06_019347 [Nelumbo nucifera]